jgi:hypothetical protein
METDFAVKVVARGDDYSDIVVRSLNPEGLPGYSPSFISDVICAVRSDLGLNPRKVEFEGPESCGLSEVRARVYPH